MACSHPPPFVLRVAGSRRGVVTRTLSSVAHHEKALGLVNPPHYVHDGVVSCKRTTTATSVTGQLGVIFLGGECSGARRVGES